MKKLHKIFILIFSLFLLVPISSYALSEDYEDIIYKIVDKEVEENKINLYLFHRNGCPHCSKEKEFLEVISKKYENVNIYMFEVSTNKTNSNYLSRVKTLFNESSNGVPYTVIGKETFLGYNEYIGSKIENTVQKYLNAEEVTETEKNTFDLPILGDINVKDASISLVAIVLGLIDGFNPCALWILLFLINLFFGMKNKKKMFILGYTFLFVSALVYFLSMLGITVVLNITTISWIQKIIALVALVAGIFNIRTFIKTRNDSGCHVVDEKKRKKIFKSATKIVKEKSLVLSILGISMLAISVNLVELACSLGFPAIFSEILAINDVAGISRVLYILLYVICYMIDDLIVFTIAVCTLSITARSTKYTKYLNLVAGILMIIMGLLLIYKPELIMFDL